MSWSGAGPTATPNPMNPPPLPHNRQQGDSTWLDVKWFIAGLVLVAALIGGFIYWTISSPPTAELEYADLQTAIRMDIVRELTISGNQADGRFELYRASYDGKVWLESQPPDGYSEEDARPVTAFTSTIPDGEVDNVYELAIEVGISVERD